MSRPTEFHPSLKDLNYALMKRAVSLNARLLIGKIASHPGPDQATDQSTPFGSSGSTKYDVITAQIDKYGIQLHTLHVHLETRPSLKGCFCYKKRSLGGRPLYRLCTNDHHNPRSVTPAEAPRTTRTIDRELIKSKDLEEPLVRAVAVYAAY